MDNNQKLINTKYSKLYENYYDNNETLDIKRKLSAIETARNIVSVTREFTNLSLIDIGAGNGNVLVELSGSGIFNKMVALEISESGIEAIKLHKIAELTEVDKFDGYHIPYRNKEFDLAIAVHVLEHVEHERLFVQELGRVSKRLFIEVPLEHGFNIRKAIMNGKNTGHINFYTIETLVSLLESSGFRVVSSRVATPSTSYEQLLYGVIKGKVKNKIRNLLLKLL
jgi:ubiquinone/menaquinone biosynthesis C-methylase UbiE